MSILADLRRLLALAFLGIAILIDRNEVKDWIAEGVERDLDAVIALRDRKEAVH